MTQSRKSPRRGTRGSTTTQSSREGRIFEHSRPGDAGTVLPELDVPGGDCFHPLFGRGRRGVRGIESIDPHSPDSKVNNSIDAGIYPLG